MYILKNAVKNVARSKGRNALIGVIVLVIAVSCCIALSIRQAADSAKQSGLDSLNITATISVDRTSMMRNIMGGSGDRGGFDGDAFREMLSGTGALTLDELLYYAGADSVNDFYYQMSVSLNGNDALEPLETEQNTSAQGGMGGRAGAGQYAAQGDFTVIGYGTDSAMTDFISGNSAIIDGVMFDEGTSQQVCVISNELAIYNSLNVGDFITLVNPNSTEEAYTLEIVGIYENSSASASVGFSMSDPANEIYTSFTALKAIADASAAVSAEVTNEDTGITTTTQVTSQISGIYSFADVSSYESFQEEVVNMGLEETYTVSSSDITSYEQSLVPLENLSKFALGFLIVVLIIGAVILVVLNAFNIRERKYEIGVLTAIGMKKHKVAFQFITEIFTVTITVILIGAILGAAVSLPVTNKLLESQIVSEQSTSTSREQSFGRPMGEDNGGVQAPNMNGGGVFGGTASYISEVSSATNWTVIFELLGLGILLTLVAGVASLVFIMRYEPLKILSNRD